MIGYLVSASTDKKGTQLELLPYLDTDDDTKYTIFGVLLGAGTLSFGCEWINRHVYSKGGQ